MATAVERTYAARRLEPGLYLQPSNDGKRWFVIHRYEDGRMHGLEHGPWVATYWGYEEIDIHRIQAVGMNDPERALEMIREHGYDGYYKTKREAVDAALKT